MGVNDFAIGYNIDTAIGKKSYGKFMGYFVGSLWEMIMGEE